MCFCFKQPYSLNQYVLAINDFYDLSQIYEICFIFNRLTVFPVSTICHIDHKTSHKGQFFLLCFF